MKTSVRKFIRKLRGSSCLPKMNKQFAYTTMWRLYAMARKGEKEALKLHGDAKQRALEYVKYFRDLADEILEKI